MPTVLITGTSTGFGRVSHGTALAARGWRVFATMRDLARKGSLERALRDAGPLRARSPLCSSTSPAPLSIEAAVKSILAADRQHAPMRSCTMPALPLPACLKICPTPIFRRVMETNFFGVLNLTRALLPIFREQRRGRIVLLSSQAAFAGQPGNSMYCASKWALEGWAESLAYEVDPFGIDVVLIEPGPYRTEIWNSTKWVVPSDSAYLSWLKLLRHAADRHQAKTSRDPKEVALVVGKALEARRPRFRYQVGLLRQAGLLPPRQDADEAHPQGHHALSRPSAGKVVVVPFTCARAERPLPR